MWDDGAGRVYMGVPHGGDNQRFYVEHVGANDFKLHVKSNPSLCLDLNTFDNQIYMGGCHDGDNQRFYFSDSTGAIVGAERAFASRIKTRYGGSNGGGYANRCLDYNAGNYELYFSPCHDGPNQKFFFAQTP